MRHSQAWRARFSARATLTSLVLAALALAGLTSAAAAPAASSTLSAPAPIAPAAIEVKVVIVTMFEIGADTGDTPGDFQLWHERQKLDERFPFAHHHNLFLNRQTGVLAMVTGEGTANSVRAGRAHCGREPGV
jgi:purine nucleoside permease